MDVIVGTDWWTDCDDVAAMRLLARKHKEGKIRICGVVLNACMEYSAPSLSAFLSSEGLHDIPIGIDRAATDFGRREQMYQENMAKYPHDLENDQCEDAVALYRRLLSAADEPIDLIEIGYPQVLAQLLQSEGDAYSPDNGQTLVEKRVHKLWMMAGNWEAETGLENNFARNERSRKAAKIVCDRWPTEITFLGWEVGYDVITGGAILSKDDILYRAMADIGCAEGRSSWDPMLCLLAVIGDEERAGYGVVRGTASVDDTTGENRFAPSENGRHAYVVKRLQNGAYESMINEIIV